MEVTHLNQPGDLRCLYRALPDLFPALVILEDVDTLASQRTGPASHSLSDFLNALDGVRVSDSPIVTLMTTNDEGQLDEAPLR